MQDNKSFIKLNFEAISIKWLQSKNRQIKKVTELSYYRILSRHIMPFFYNKKLKELEQIDIDNFIDDINNKINYHVLSYKYAQDITCVFKSIIKFINNESSLNFICKSICIKKTKHKRIDTYLKTEQQIIINECLANNDYKKTGILIALFCGVRIGELCAIQWKDINFEKETLSINKTIQRIYDYAGSYLKIDSPKTINSNREIPICRFLLRIIKKIKKEDDCYILTGKTHPMEPRNYRRFYDKFIQKLNIHRIKFHGLRHTFATTCIEAGIDYKTVSELLGHSSINITMNTYVHISLDHKRKCLEKLAKYLY